MNILKSNLYPNFKYLLQVWGADDEYIYKEYGQTKFWFDTKEQRDKFLKTIYGYRNLMRDTCDDHNSRIFKKVYLVYQYKGQTYEITKDVGYGFEDSSIRYIHQDGNFGCDCNRSVFIKNKYPDFPELDCGNEIKLIKIKIIKKRHERL